MSKDTDVSEIDLEKASEEAAAKKRAAENDKRAKEAEKSRPRDRAATVTQIDGADKQDSDATEEFQKQKADAHFRIVIPSSNDPTEVKRIPVGVNGVIYTILRDVEVVVPKCILDALDIATETRYRKGPQKPDGTVEMIPYEAKSYLYQNLGEAPKTAIHK